jgi:hypothetical protein
MSRYDRYGLVFSFGTVAALLMTSAAYAVTVTNRSDKEIKISVIVGTVTQDHVLEIGKGVVGVCQQGCIIRLNDSDSDEYELEGSEVVSIDGGFLYYDGFEARTTPAKSGVPTGQAVPE